MCEVESKPTPKSSCHWLWMEWVYCEAGLDKKLYPLHPIETIVFPVLTWALMILFKTASFRSLDNSYRKFFVKLLIIPMTHIGWLEMLTNWLSSTENLSFLLDSDISSILYMLIIIINIISCSF